MPNTFKTIPSAAKTDFKTLSVDLLRGFRLHIAKQKALVILHNLTSSHKLMLCAEYDTDCYFVISESDMRLFSYMANTYDAPFEMVPIPEIAKIHQRRAGVYVSGDKELSSALF